MPGSSWPTWWDAIPTASAKRSRSSAKPWTMALSMPTAIWECTHKQGKRAEAEAAFREALESGSEEAAYNLGLFLLRFGGDLGEAERRFGEAIAAGTSKAHNDLGLLLMDQPGREAEAEASFRKAIDAGDAKAFNNLGILLTRLGRDKVRRRGGRVPGSAQVGTIQ